MTTVLIVGWAASMLIAFTAGEMCGQSKADKWWHQFGIQIFGKGECAAICVTDGCAMLDDPQAIAAKDR